MEERKQAMFKRSNEKAKKPLPKVEKLPTHFYEEGITQFENMCRMRQVIAIQHHLGNKEYSFYDLIQALVHKKMSTFASNGS